MNQSKKFLSIYSQIWPVCGCESIVVQGSSKVASFFSFRKEPDVIQLRLREYTHIGLTRLWSFCSVKSKSKYLKWVVLRSGSLFWISRQEHRIRANRAPLLIRMPWDQSWAYYGYFGWNLSKISVFLDEISSKMILVHNRKLLKFDKTSAFYWRKCGDATIIISRFAQWYTGTGNLFKTGCANSAIYLFET